LTGEEKYCGKSGEREEDFFHAARFRMLKNVFVNTNKRKKQELLFFIAVMVRTINMLLLSFVLPGNYTLVRQMKDKVKKKSESEGSLCFNFQGIGLNGNHFLF